MGVTAASNKHTRGAYKGFINVLGAAVILYRYGLLLPKAVLISS